MRKKRLGTILGTNYLFVPFIQKILIDNQITISFPLHVFGNVNTFIRVLLIRVNSFRNIFHKCAQSVIGGRGEGLDLKYLATIIGKYYFIAINMFQRQWLGNKRLHKSISHTLSH